MLRHILLAGAARPFRRCAARRCAGAAPAVTAPPIEFTEWKLANGLTVISMRDTTTANVMISLWYDVGSKHDPRGPLGLRPPVRAYSQPQDREHALQHDQPADRGRRRQAQRLDRRRPHQLLRDRPGRISRDDAVDPCRAHGPPGGRRPRCSRTSATSSRRSCASACSRRPTAACSAS